MAKNPESQERGSSPPPGGSTPIDVGTWRPTDVSRLLKLAMHDERRPLDDLIDWIRSQQRPDALPSLLQEILPAADPAALLLEDGIALERLRELKEDGKRAYARSETERKRLAGLALYFLAVAIALVHHQQKICSKSRHDLDPLLLDFADAAPERFADLLCRATGVPD